MMTDGNSSISRYTHTHSLPHAYTFCPICTAILEKNVALSGLFGNKTK